MRRQWYKFHYFMDQYFRPVTKWLLIANVAIFIVQHLLLLFVDAVFKTGINEFIILWFTQIPSAVVQKYQVWRLVTYGFLHVSGIHLIFNMMILFFFGSMVEDYMGSRRYLRFYFIVVIGAAIFQTAFHYLVTRDPDSIMLGSSGGMFGVLVAAAVMAPNQTVMWNFLFPIKMKYMVLIIIVLEFIMLAGSGIGGTSNVSHITHLSGAGIAFVLLMWPDWWDRIGPRRRRRGPQQVYRRFDGLR